MILSSAQRASSPRFSSRILPTRRTGTRRTRAASNTNAVVFSQDGEVGIKNFKDNSHEVHYGEVCVSDDEDFTNAFEEEGEAKVIRSRRKRRDALSSIARKAESKSNGKKKKRQDKAREKAMRGLENLILNTSGSDGMKAKKKQEEEE